MPIKLFDSLTREIRELRRPDPNNPKDVFSFYNCGPTVYAPAHIGNFRTFIVNDVLRRLLELEYGKDKVRYVRNLTDVDDKTIKRSRDEGRPLAEVTKQWTQKFHDDCARLNCLPVSEKFEPTATGYIREQVNMIDVLMKKGNAYRAPDGSVYFKVSSFPNYGTLSRVKERELKSGSAFAADADEKEDLSDFALWKAHKADDGDNAWDSPWGRGRPGWHIECSAMSKALLGDTIDLHTGGVDLLFPHHENEIAQSECCNGTKFSRHWYHSEHLLVDGKKMSKSLGNLYTLDDLTAKDFSPMALRYALLMGHPRKQLNFMLDSLHAAEKALSGILAKVREMGACGNALHFRRELDQIIANDEGTDWGSFTQALNLLCDDLNTPAALGAAFTAFKNITDLDLSQDIPWQRWRVEFLAAKRFFEQALGINLNIQTDDEQKAVLLQVAKIPVEIMTLAEKRWAAKKAKDFAGADALRKELTAAGWSMLDGKDGYKLEPIKR
jgi:cysteinyl-tRNA synthetase